MNFDTPGSSFSRKVLKIIEIDTKCVIFDTIHKAPVKRKCKFLYFYFIELNICDSIRGIRA